MGDKELTGKTEVTNASLVNEFEKTLTPKGVLGEMVNVLEAELARCGKLMQLQQLSFDLKEGLAQIFLERDQIAIAPVEVFFQDLNGCFAPERQMFSRGKDSLQFFLLIGLLQIKQSIGASGADCAGGQRVFNWLGSAQFDSAESFTLAWAHPSATSENWFADSAARRGAGQPIHCRCDKH